MAERSKHHEPLNITIYFKNPSTGIRSSKSLRYLQSTTFDEVLGDAYKSFEVESIAPLNQCSLLGYDSNRDEVCNSFYDEETAIGLIWRGTEYLFAFTSELLLDIHKDPVSELIKQKEEEPKQCIIYLPTTCFGYDAIKIQAYKETTVEKVKKQIADKMELNETSTMILALVNTSVKGNKPEILQNDAALNTDSISTSNDVEMFMTLFIGEEKFKKLIEEKDFLWKSCGYLPGYFKSFPLKKKTENLKLKVEMFPSYHTITYYSNEVYEEKKFLFKFVLIEYFVDYENEYPDKNQSNLSDNESVQALEKTVDDLVEQDENNEKHSKESGSDVSGENDLENVDKERHIDSRLIKILVDIRMTVKEFLNNLQQYMKIPDRSVFHFTDESLSLSEICKLEWNLECNLEWNITKKITEFVKLGRALMEGEMESILFHRSISDNREWSAFYPYRICHYVIKRSAEVGQTKREILEHIRKLDDKYANLTFERTILRLLRDDKPARILPDDTKFSDVPPIDEDYDKFELWGSYVHSPFFIIMIQELSSEENRLFDSAGQPITIINRSFFARRFFPSELVLSRWKKLIVGKSISTVPQMKSFLSKVSGIPENNIKYTIIPPDNELSIRIIDELIENNDLKTEKELKSDLIKLNKKDYRIIYKDRTENLPEDLIEEKSLKAFRRPFTAGR